MNMAPQLLRSRFDSMPRTRCTVAIAKRSRRSGSETGRFNASRRTTISASTLTRSVWRSARDRDAGFQPACVVGNAGTVNTGAIDDLRALADLAVQENLWFHVDGCIGALLAIAPDNAYLLGAR